MFTGLIEEIGTVKNTPGKSGGEIVINASHILPDTNLGDSIAINGTCLTVTEMGDAVFTADVLAETMRMTSLCDLRIGSEVNLERAMQAGGRFGGHIVTGHIDGTGLITKMTSESNGIWITVSADNDLMKQITLKGSIAVDGVSLTVARISKKDFSVCIIPHTGEETTLTSKQVGDKLNIEIDPVAKYVSKILGLTKEVDGINEDQIIFKKLMDTGFI